jgi:hypothetical protein
MKIYRIAKTSNIQLPSIPNGMCRAVHITSANPNNFFSNGFDYSSQGILQSTARVFTNNEQILQDGLFSKYDSRFMEGYAIIIDLPIAESKLHQSSFVQMKRIIPSNFILGAFSSHDNSLILNKSYNPSGSSIPEGYSFLQENEYLPEHGKSNIKTVVPSPSVYPQDNVDVF